MTEDATTTALREQLAQLPKAPGCYIFRDRAGKVIYVGKALVLRTRVRSYFSEADDGRLFTPYLRSQIASVETVVTQSEQEALVLENNLIKKFNPRFNIHLRDDKTYVQVAIDLTHEWPRAVVGRRFPRRKGLQVHGPYSSAAAIRETLKALRPVFPLRLCSDHTLYNRSRPCLYHDIGHCSAPCVGRVDHSTYQAAVQGLSEFLKGRDQGLVEQMRHEMQAAAAALDFEKAAELRDRVATLEEVLQIQRAEMAGDATDRDVLGTYRAGEDLQVHVLVYRDGKMLNSASHRFASPLPDAEVVRQFIMQYYGEGNRQIPREILTPIELDDAGLLGLYLAKKAGHAVDIRTPRRGALHELVQLATTNAKYAYKDLVKTEEREEALLRELQELLGLSQLPTRIECYDISTLMGTNTVASQVTFVHGRPAKDEYKRYRISAANAGNDFDAMAEVLQRRVRRSIEEDDPLPELLVVDGGPPQLARAQEVLERAGVIDVDLVALAKSRQLRKLPPGVRSPERVYKPGREEPIVLEAEAPPTYLMQRVRDEAHRFAITYHRKQRQKAAMRTGLDGIPGLGPKRKHKLIEHFGSTNGVRNAELDEIAAVEGISQKLAETVYEYFRQQRERPDAEDEVLRPPDEAAE